MCVHTQQRLRRVAYIPGKFGCCVANIPEKLGGAAANKVVAQFTYPLRLFIFTIQQRLSHSGTQMVGLIHTCFPLARSTNF